MLANQLIEVKPETTPLSSVERQPAPYGAHAAAPGGVPGPPGNVVAALPLTLLDNLRDLFEVAACASPRVAPALETFGRAGVAGLAMARARDSALLSGLEILCYTCYMKPISAITTSNWR